VQTKLFRRTERQVLASAAKDTLTITNDEERKANFHNIHWSGRVFSNNAETDAYGSGYLVLMCIEQQQTVIPAVVDDVILEKMQGQIILAKQWFTFGGLTTMTAASLYDFNFDLGKISRNCSKEGRLIAAVYVDSGSPNAVVLTHDLTCNITQA